MKIIKRDFENMPFLTILPLGDLHIGSPEADITHIKTLIADAMTDPYTYVVLNGDIVDMAMPGAFGGPYAATMQPGQQINTAVSFLRGLAEAGKILCIMDGNHEERLGRTAGVSPAQMIAGQLGIMDVCTDATALLFLTVGAITYTVYVTHGGSSGCKVVSSKIERLSQMADVLDADLYISGHTHLPATFRQGYMRIDREHGTMEQVERLFVNSASALRYGGYAETQGQPVPPNTYPMINISGDMRRMRVYA